MTIPAREITINLDLKRTLAVGAFTLISVITLYTFISAVLAFDIGAQSDPPLQVNSFYAYDEFGSSTISQGERIYIYITVEMAQRYWQTSAYYNFLSGTDFAIIMTIIDDNGVPIYFDYIDDPAFHLDPGSVRQYVWIRDYGFDFTVPVDAEGYLHVMGMVWEPGDPFGWALSPDPGEFEFYVVPSGAT